MAQREKLIERLKSAPKDFNWGQAVKLMGQLGFRVLEGEGSRVRFHHDERNVTILLHKPHPGSQLPRYAVRMLRDKLLEEGMI